MITFLVAPMAVARHFAAPPGVPPERTRLLRRGFDAAMRDSDFLADAAKIGADISPTGGEAVQNIVAGIYATPPPVIARAKKFSAP